MTRQPIVCVVSMAISPVMNRYLTPTKCAATNNHVCNTTIDNTSPATHGSWK
ncbi:unnamed protein product [Schistosoma mattheei]|uniref:Uncharacterized protein n=1 Tax=Schistosoma mattheei TaxID=31246 RepID=A0A183PY08_9TREM|nr:unnamed protein product [Schistosoma mattheei]